MFSQLRCLSLLAVAATSYAESQGSQLRGSAAVVPAGSASQGDVDALSDVQHTDCGCHSGSCKCLQTGSGLSGQSEEQQGLQLELLNHTQALDAWWQELGEKKVSLQCACSGEAGSCNCMQSTDGSDSAAVRDMPDGENSSTVADTLSNETEHLMSLWWVAHGGGYRRYGYGYRGYGGCRHVGYTGCGCRYYGCHCGHVGYRGCR